MYAAIDECAMRFAQIPEQRQSLIEFLAQGITPERMQRLQTVLSQRTRHIAVMLENIFQAQNASAVLRSCECFGIQDVYTVETQNAFVVDREVDMSASKWLTLHHFNTHQQATTQAITTIRNKGYKIIATSPYAEHTLDSIDLSQPIALMFGTELTGLTEIAMAQADDLVRIPMYGFIESFNISVSAAICLHTLTTRLRASQHNYGLSPDERDDLMLRWLLHSTKHWHLLVERFCNTQ